MKRGRKQSLGEEIASAATIDAAISTLETMEMEIPPVGRDEPKFRQERDGSLMFVPVSFQSALNEPIPYNERLGCHAIGDLPRVQYVVTRLLDLSVLIGMQLTGMDRPYIVKCVFDPFHIAILAFSRAASDPMSLDELILHDANFSPTLNQNMHLEPGVHITDGRKACIVGGCAFRPFPSFGFVELVFFAVDGKKQSDGLGTRLMNNLKEWCRAAGYFHIITYADNEAINYFAKQGYSKIIECPEKWYLPAIKHYDRATPMECVISPLIPPAFGYTDLPRLFRKQRRTYLKDMMLRASAAGAPHILITSPDDPRLGYVPPTAAERSTVSLIALKVTQELWNKPAFHHFRVPVDATMYATYYAIIKDPISMQEIIEKLKHGGYITLAQWAADMERIKSNCQAFNDHTSEIYQSANYFVDAYQFLACKAIKELKPSERDAMITSLTPYYKERTAFPDL